MIICHLDWRAEDEGVREEVYVVGPRNAAPGTRDQILRIVQTAIAEDTVRVVRSDEEVRDAT